MTFLLLALGILLLPRRLSSSDGRRGGSRISLPVLAGTAATVAVAGLGGRFGLLLALPAGFGGWWLARGLVRHGKAEINRPATALVLELIAAALAAGLPVPAAIDAVDRSLSGCPEPWPSTIEPFRLVGRLLLLGGEPEQTWAEFNSRPGLAAVAAAGRRCAHSGARLAGALTAVAAELRADEQTAALRHARRLAVWTLLPLGCCFLPAFVCLGVVPVVIGVAGQVISGGLAL